MNEEQIKKLIQKELEVFLSGKKFIFQFPIQILDGRNIQTGRSTGTQIGTATDQLVGFYGTAPVDQGAAVASPAANVDQLKTAVDALRTRLSDIGIIAS